MNLAGFFKFWQTYRNISRIRQIVNVFLKHGFGQFIEQINLQRFIPLRKRVKTFGQWRASRKFSAAERLRIAFSELGPSFIKLAQILSSRPDVITFEYADEFAKLQDEVPPFPASEAIEVIEAELGKPIDEIFSYFEEMPAAAASMAQVHFARLKDGADVIIKVQRPGIRKLIETDVAIMNSIARLMLRHMPDLAAVNPDGLVEEFAKTVNKELDFVGEARNSQKLKKNLQDNPHIVIPAIYPDLLSEKVIVMERIEGVRIDDIEAIDSYGINRHDLAINGVNAYFKMILEDGFFHADPHPGNIFVMPDGKMGLMDFGIVGRLTKDMMENIANTFIAFINKDFDALIDEYINLGIIREETDPDTMRKGFKNELVEMLEPIYDVTISEINIIEQLENVTHLAIKHGLSIPSNLILVNKTILMLDHIGRTLDPGFNFIVVAEPYAAEIIKNKMSPKRIFEKTRKNVDEIGNFLATTPRQVNRLLAKTIKNELSFKVDPIGIDRLIRDIDRSSNRLAFSIIVASIIVGSSLLIQSGVGGKVFGLPAVGAFGFLIAFVLGLGLLLSILRSGRL